MFLLALMAVCFFTVFFSSSGEFILFLSAKCHPLMFDVPGRNINLKNVAAMTRTSTNEDSQQQHVSDRNRWVRSSVRAEIRERHLQEAVSVSALNVASSLSISWAVKKAPWEFWVSSWRVFRRRRGSWSSNCREPRSSWGTRSGNAGEAEDGWKPLRSLN